MEANLERFCSILLTELEMILAIFEVLMKNCGMPIGMVVPRVYNKRKREEEKGWNLQTCSRCRQ